MSRTSQDLNGVDSIWFNRCAVNFDDSEVVIINGDHEIWVARNGDKAKAVTLAPLYTDNCQTRIRTTGVASFAVDQCGIGLRDTMNCR